MKRPIGISILVVYMGLGVISSLSGGFILLLLMIIQISSGIYDGPPLILLLAIIVTVFALSYLIFWEARGLWNMRPKARIWTIRLIVGTVIICSLCAAIPATAEYISSEDLLYMLPQAAVILIYLHRPSIIQLFTDEPVDTSF